MYFEGVQFDSHCISTKGSIAMTTKACMWGASIGIRLPKYIAEVANVQAGDYLFITVNDAEEIVIRPVKPRDVHPGYARAGSKGTTKTVVPAVEEKW